MARTIINHTRRRTNPYYVIRWRGGDPGKQLQPGEAISIPWNGHGFHGEFRVHAVFSNLGGNRREISGTVSWTGLHGIKAKLWQRKDGSWWIGYNKADANHVADHQWNENLLEGRL